MLHQAYLFNPSGPDLLIGRQVARFIPDALQSIHLVVPRELSVYHRVQCSGIPRLKLSGFARLQARTLTPFSSHGGCAVKQGNWLHIWTWDAELERAFQAKHPNKQVTKTLSHSLYSPQNREVVWMKAAASSGVEAQLRKGTQLVHTLWFEKTPTPEEWSDMLAESPEITAYGWPQTLSSTPVLMEYAQQPWAGNLIHAARATPRAALNKAIPVMLTLSSAYLAGWGGYHYAQRESQQTAIHAGAESQERMLAELEPLRLAKQNATQTLNWIETTQQLSPTPNTHGILTELASILSSQGLVVRELELAAPTVQVTVLSTTGNPPRLTSVLSSVEAHPWFYDARFVDVVGGNGFKFAWRLRSNGAAKSANAAEGSAP